MYINITSGEVKTLLQITCHINQNYALNLFYLSYTTHISALIPRYLIVITGLTDNIKIFITPTPHPSIAQDTKNLALILQAEVRTITQKVVTRRLHLT